MNYQTMINNDAVFFAIPPSISTSGWRRYIRYTGVPDNWGISGGYHRRTKVFGTTKRRLRDSHPTAFYTNP